jgi:hypothetical protein
MASKEPSLIRSTKAFSVEIPEGSTSAKAKRSDIVAGEVDELGPALSHFEEQLEQKALKQSSENVSLDTQQAFEAEHGKADIYAKGQEDALQDSKTGFSSDHLHSQPGMGVATDSLHNHLVSVADDHAKDDLVGVADDHVEDHLVGIANDASNEHSIAISNESLHDTHAPLPDNATEDHHVAVADTEPVEPIPLFVNANDDFPDDHMEIEDPPEENLNTQALTDDTLGDHIELVEEEKPKLADLNLLPDTPAPVLPTQTKPAAQIKQQPIAKKAPEAPTNPEMIKQQQEALLARQHRMEEFHGRVDAIRKTVNDINSKLDHISPQEKKNH